MTLEDALSVFSLKSLDGVNLSSLKGLYRKLAKKTHPDNEGGSHDGFVQLREAYILLSNNLEEETDNSQSRVIKKMSKDEILAKYNHDIKDLQLKLDSYQDIIDEQLKTLDFIKERVSTIINKYENQKTTLKEELEIEIKKLEKQIEPKVLSKLLFFLPQMSEDEFWNKYNQNVGKYTRKNTDLDQQFFKYMLEAYGNGLNDVSKQISRAAK